MVEDTKLKIRGNENTPNGIMDITDTPDVAVWSKGIRKGLHVPSDTVKEPSKVKSTSLRVETQQQGKAELAVDPANKKDVEKAVAMGASLTDESDLSEKSPANRKTKVPKS